MKNIIFIAPPAAGKGTLSEIIKEKYNIPHISTGDLLRSVVLKEDENSKKIKAILESGQLVTDEIVLDLLRTRICAEDCQNGYILDGFPRNIHQAEEYNKLLTSLGKNLGVVILLEVDENLAKERIVGRVSCPKCGAVYNTYFEQMRPKKAGICDRCMEKLISRSDDNAETFAQRWDTYLKSTAPLIQYYEDMGVLYRINSTDINIAVEEIEKILK